MSSDDKYIKGNRVYASYHDMVCSIGYDKDKCVEVFYNECFNESLTQEQINKAYELLKKAKSIHSPYLMNIIDVIIKDSSFIVVTEPTDSPSLYTYIKKLDKIPPEKNVLKWFKNLVLAVQSLHSSDIVHGNISLHNVFYKNSPTNIKLLMPVANLSLRQISKQSTDISPYRAPELLNGELSKANDIWALGICLLELLTHENVYSECTTPMELVRKLVDSSPPSSLKNISDQRLRELIERCLLPSKERIDINELYECVDKLEGMLSGETQVAAETDSELII